MNQPTIIATSFNLRHTPLDETLIRTLENTTCSFAQVSLWPDLVAALKDSADHYAATEDMVEADEFEDLEKENDKIKELAIGACDEIDRVMDDIEDMIEEAQEGDAQEQEIIPRLRKLLADLADAGSDDLRMACEN